MKLFKHTIMAALLLGALSGCGSAEDSAGSFIENGKSLLAEGKFKKARLEFKNAIQIDPRMAEPFYQLALIDENNQKWKGMFANLTTAEQLDPTHYDAIVKLGQIHLLAGNFDIAMEKADGVIDADKTNVLAWVLRASVNMKQSNFTAAMNDVEQGLLIDSSNIEVLSVKTLVLHKQGNTKQALLILDDTIKANPDELPLYMIKVTILEEQKDYVAIEQVYKILQTKQPDAMWVPVSMAKLFNMQNRYDDAKQVLQQFIESHPDEEKAKLLLVSLVKSKEPKQAIVLLDQYIEQDNNNFDLRFAKVQLQLTAGELDAGLKELQQISDLDPEGNSGRKAQIMLAGHELQQGNKELAETQLKQVLEVAPEDEAALLLNARIQLINNDVDAAVTSLRLVLRNNPESDQAMVLLAQAYMNSGSTELADDNFRQALVVNPGNTIAALSVARGLLKDKELNRTEEVLLKALEKTPKKETLLQVLAQVKLLMKDWDGTQDIINTLRADYKGTAVVHYLSARTSQGQEQFSDAVKEYKAALAISPKMTRALQGLVFSSFKLGKNKELVTYLYQFIETNPGQFAAYAVISDIYAGDKSWDKAIAIIEKGLEADVKWPSAYSRLASIYLAQQDMDLAISSYQRGLKANPENNALSLQLASAFEQKGDFEQAKILYEAVLSRNDSIDAAANNLASLLTDQFRSPENLKKAAALAENLKTATEPYFLDTYAWVNIQLGHIDKVAGILENVVKRSPDVAVFNYHLAVWYLKQGNNDEAEKYLKRAQTLAEKQGDTATGNSVEALLSEI